MLMVVWCGDCGVAMAIWCGEVVWCGDGGVMVVW